MDAVREMGVTTVRYPGGNFVSFADWKHAIGPRESRPRTREFAWRSIETNQFGTDDFCHWCRAVGADPMIAVNLGTGTPKEAAELVEFTNLSRGTHWADLREQEEPYDVKLWCLGNEMDGPWQAGQVPAHEYAL
jgi:alpha-L-arabinofuranosidase